MTATFVAVLFCAVLITSATSCTKWARALLRSDEVSFTNAALFTVTSTVATVLWATIAILFVMMIARLIGV